MVLGDLSAVAEHVGQNRRWDFSNEFAQCPVPCSAQVNAQSAQSLHARLGIDVLPGSVSGKQPRGPHRGGPKICATLEEFIDEYCERRGHWYRFGSEPKAHVGRSEKQVVDGECDDLADWLCVEKQQQAGNAVLQRVDGPDDQVADQRDPLVLVQYRCRCRVPVADDDGLVELGLSCPDEECADVVAGRGPAGEVLVDVVLIARGRGSVVLGV